MGSHHLDEAKEALKSLGYLEKEINQIMPTLRNSNIQEVDHMIRHALSLLVKN